MAAKLGQVAYICLSEAFEDPRWREGLVVGIRHHTVQLVVRSNDVKELGPDIARFEHKKVSFFLLECPATHLRAACNNRPLCLGVDSGDLLTEGKIYVESDPELQFATASDPEPVAAGRKKGSKMKEPDSDASSSGSESEEDLVGMLSKMQKSWRGRDSGEGRGSSSSRHLTGGKRFSFLDKDNKKSKGSKMVEPTSTQKILDSLDTEKDPIKMLVALQLASAPSGRRKEGSETSESQCLKGVGRQQVSIQRSLSLQWSETFRPRQSHRELSWSSSPDVQKAAASCEAVRERSGKAPRCQRQTISSVGTGQKDQLGQAEIIAASSLHDERSAGIDAEGPDGESLPAAGLVSESCPPNGVGSRRLGGELDDNPSRESVQPSKVGRRRSRAGQCSSLSQIDGGAGEEHSQAPCPELLHHGPRRGPCKAWKPKQEREEGQGQGQSREGRRRRREGLSSQAPAVEAPKTAKSVFNSLLSEVSG